MKFARKMVLVDLDEDVTKNVPQKKSSHVVELDKKLTQILHTNEMNDFDKCKLYMETFQKYLFFVHQEKSAEEKKWNDLNQNLSTICEIIKEPCSKIIRSEKTAATKKTVVNPKRISRSQSPKSLLQIPQQSQMPIHSNFNTGTIIPTSEPVETIPVTSKVAKTNISTPAVKPSTSSTIQIAPTVTQTHLNISTPPVEPAKSSAIQNWLTIKEEK